MHARPWRSIIPTALLSHAAACSILLLTSVGAVSCGGSKPPPLGSADETYARAQEHYARRKWEKARVAYEQFVFNFPGAARVDSAQFMLGMCYFNLEDFISARDEFERLRRRYPSSTLVEDADLLQCRSLMSVAPENPSLDQQRTEDAIRQLRLFKDLHPLSAHVRTADSLLAVADGRLSQRDFKAGRLYHRMGRFGAARVYMQEVIDKYPGSPLIPEAVYYIAEGYRKQDSLSRSIEYFEKLIYLYPEHERTKSARRRVADLARRRDQRQALDGDGH
jgi:outer membrane protein assembly factor BamD